MLSEADMRLGEMLALNLPAHAEAVEELVDSAQKESQVYSLCLLFTSTKSTNTDTSEGAAPG
jgi:hypothetical protein